MPPLILASTSRYRRELLARLGLPFTALAPDCDEEALKRPGIPPRQLAEELADAKARSLRTTHPDAVIIGSDQVCAVDDAILSKPGTPERAMAILARLQGRTHQLITAVTISGPDGEERHTDVTTLTMRSLDAAAIARYVAADAPLDCAGAYKLECRGIALMETVTSADHTAIVGLPLMAVTRMLARFGLAVP
jgi:septum formation protein